MTLLSDNETFAKLYQTGNLDRVERRTNCLNNAVAIGFVDDLNTGRSGFISLFSDKHTPILPTGHPKLQPLPCKNKDLQAFLEGVLNSGKYVRAIGRGIKGVLINNMSYNENNANLSIVNGYNENRSVKNIVFENLKTYGKLIWDKIPGKPGYFLPLAWLMFLSENMLRA